MLLHYIYMCVHTQTILNNMFPAYPYSHFLSLYNQTVRTSRGIRSNVSKYLIGSAAYMQTPENNDPSVSLDQAVFIFQAAQKLCKAVFGLSIERKKERKKACLSSWMK